jgi:hypothetical protein
MDEQWTADDEAPGELPVSNVNHELVTKHDAQQQG